MNFKVLTVLFSLEQINKYKKNVVARLQKDQNQM